MPINRISDEKIDAIKRKTAYALPNRPSEKGLKAEDIKKALYGPLLDKTNSIVEVVNNAIDETNEVLERVEGRVDELKETSFSVDTTSTGSIAYTIKDNESKSFVANGITDVEITIPSTVSAGFSGGVNFKCGSTPPTVSFVNESDKALKLVQFCAKIDEYIPQVDVTCRMLVDCDEGDTVTVWIVEA